MKYNAVYLYILLLKKDGHQTCLSNNIQCNKVKVIVTLFSCFSDFDIF